jgi:hypothetical protein
MSSVALVYTKADHIRLHNQGKDELLEENIGMITTEMSALNKYVRKRFNQVRALWTQVHACACASVPVHACACMGACWCVPKQSWCMQGACI